MTRKGINDINEPGMKYKGVFKSWSDEMNWVNGAQSESRLAKLWQSESPTILYIHCTSHISYFSDEKEEKTKLRCQGY